MRTARISWNPSHCLRRRWRFHPAASGGEGCNTSLSLHTRYAHRKTSLHSNQSHGGAAQPAVISRSKRRRQRKITSSSTLPIKRSRSFSRLQITRLSLGGISYVFSSLSTSHLSLSWPEPPAARRSAEERPLFKVDVWAGSRAQTWV